MPSRVYSWFLLRFDLLTPFLTRDDPVQFWPRFCKDEHSDKVSLDLDQNCPFKSVHIVFLRIDLMTSFLTQHNPFLILAKI